ncbi:hypothetical protein [Sphingopyxis sp. H115]|uniref:hypothetical protein n=1 Tax=Sphingopyxis sp. H115 TaxID=1759073 RepID=UPI000B152B1D|nr:hypothetical protein [Sphingopyxis sp. H115]
MRTALLFLLAALMPAPALAANQVALDNSVFVERVTTDAAGKQRVLLEEPKVVVPGDRLVFVLAYRNAGAQAADKFVVTNPMPAAVRFADAGDARALVSVDGGKQWGLLADLAVPMSDGTRRAAQPADVTHIRWAFQNPIPVGGTGKLMFRGVVK